MKKPFLLSILFLSLVFQVASQNYQTVNSGRIASFKNAEDEIKFIRIDSVHFDTDSILVPFNNMQQYSDECFTPYGSHWLGKEITITPYGMNIFKTKTGYPFYIHTQAVLDESFSAFIYEMQSVVATVINHDTLTFLGIQDSVKTYTLQVYNDFNQPVNHPLNGITFKISKDHGFVQTLNFSLFPDLSNWNPLGGEMLESYDLVGLASPEVGVQNLTWMDVHDFQPGDEIHVYYYAYLIPYFSTEIQQLIHRYLEREDFADSTIYTVERVNSRFFQDYLGSTFEFTHDTIYQVFKPFGNFDKLPGDRIWVNDIGGSYAYKMINEWNVAKVKPAIDHWIFLDYGTCFIYWIIDGCYSDHKWYKGLGGPYHQCYYLGGEIERTLVYYKKGNEEWGSPLIIIGVDDVKTSSGIKVYPNPARDFLSVELKESALPAKIEIYNAMGSMLKDFKLTEPVQQVSIKGLMPGLYLYRIANEIEALGSGKLIVE